MNSERGIQAVVNVDNERLKFWKSGKLLTSIPKDLLMLTGWLDENASTTVVAERADGTFVTAPASSVKDEDYTVVFRVPRNNYDRERLESILGILRKLQSDTRHAEQLIRKRQSEGKDAERLKKDREWLMRTRGALYGRINSFLDTLRFEITDMGLEEMRYQAPSKRMWVEQIRSEMDND